MSRNTFLGRWLTFLGLLLVLLVVANALLDRFDRRLDLTDAQLHTISPESGKILSSLTDKVTITYFVSERLPAGFQNLRRDTVDFLEEYARTSDGQVEVRITDPYRLVDEYVEEKKREKAAEGEDDESGESAATSSLLGSTPEDEREAIAWADEKKRELQQRGIPELRGRSVEQDRFEIANFYSSIEIRYLDRPAEILPVHQRLDGLEYELANRIVKLTVREKPRVAFFHGRPEDFVEIPPDPNNPMQRTPRRVHPYQPLLEQVLAEQFEIVEITLTEGSTVPDDVKLFIVAQPNNLSARQVYEIDRAIARGLPTIILASSTSGSLDDPESGFDSLDPMLAPVFARWGVALGRDLVSSIDCANVDIIQQGPMGIQMRTPASFPLCPVASGRGIDQESPLTQGLSAVVVPFASVVRPNAERLAENGIEWTPLLSTSERSWLTAWEPMLTESMIRPPGVPSERGVRVLAAYLEGTFPSAFEEGSPLPAWSGATDDAGTDGEESDGSEAGDEESTGEVVPALAGAPGQVVLIGSADIAKFRSLQQYQTSVPFLLNVVETFALGQDLVNIRAKVQVARPLRRSDAWERNLATYGNLAGIPLLVLIVGLARFTLRRAAARKYEARFTGKEG